MAPNWIESLLGHRVLSISIPAFGPLPLILLPIPLFFLRRRGKSAGYLLCFSLFFLYAWAVLAHTIFPLPTSMEAIERLRGWHWSGSIHLVPAFLSGELDPRSEQIYGNFLLGVPFGFALPFVIARSSHRRVVLLGLGFSVGIELAQLVIGLLVWRGPYRVIDVDDVWVVFAGTLTGYGALYAAARVYERIGWEGGAHLPVWGHLHDVLLRVASGGASDSGHTKQDK